MRDYYEEPVERLRDSADWADHFAVLMGRADGDVHAPIMREAAEAIEDLTAALTASNEVIAKSKPQWVSVNERMPEEPSEYTVAYHPCYWDDVDLCVTKVGIDNFRGKTTWAKKKYQRVTHWMPLPEPPKEVGEE